MATGCHIALAWFARLDVDNAVEQVSFAMLTSEVLVPQMESSAEHAMVNKVSNNTYPADDVFMVRQMRFASLAAVNFAAVQVCVVRQTHVRKATFRVGEIRSDIIG